jgi:hypothetical protein
MRREEALEKIAWHHLRKLSREEAVDLIVAFFNEPLKPSLRAQLNITAIIQWETHQPPPDLQPGNSIYRPILMDKMKHLFRGATNEYLCEHLKSIVNVNVDAVTGDLPGWLACPVCKHHTFEVLGDWDDCPVCGWNSDPVQESIPDDATGANGISLIEARQNFREFGAITRQKLTELNPDAKKMYPATHQ